MLPSLVEQAEDRIALSDRADRLEDLFARGSDDGDEEEEAPHGLIKSLRATARSGIQAMSLRSIAVPARAEGGVIQGG